MSTVRIPRKFAFTMNMGPATFPNGMPTAYITIYLTGGVFYEHVGSISRDGSLIFSHVGYVGRLHGNATLIEEPQEFALWHKYHAKLQKREFKFYDIRADGRHMITGDDYVMREVAPFDLS